MREEDFNKLRANQYFLVQELERRGIRVYAVDVDNELIEAALGTHNELLLNLDSSIMSYPASVVAGEKPVAKALLMRAGISVPAGITIRCDETDKALSFATTIGYPVVVKPPVGVQGEDVYCQIEYASELQNILHSYYLRNGTKRLMLEEQVTGNEYRIFVTRRGDFAAAHRDPAHVIGDGRHTIRQLANYETYKRLHPRTNCLCEILLDEVAAAYLRKQGLSFNDVPKDGQKVYLRQNSNLKSGGTCEDVTEIVHPSVLAIAKKALAAFPGLPYAGIDLMCADISKAQTNDSYRVIEVNSLPGIGMHINPGKGKSRNVAGMIVDLMFPETVELRKAA